MESAGGNRAFHRGKQGIAYFIGTHLFIPLFSRQNPDFDEGAKRLKNFVLFLIQSCNIVEI